MARILAVLALALAAAFAAALAPAPAAAAAIDCARPALASEQTICADPLLTRLDADLAGHLEFLLTYAPFWASQEIRAGQAEWLTYRDACGADTQCLEASYRGRLARIYSWYECLRTDLPLEG